MEYFYSKAIYHIRFSSDLFDLAVSMRSFGTSHFVRKVRLCLANISHSAFQNLRILLEYISPSALHLAFPNLQHIVFDFTPRRFFDVLGTTVRHQRFADRDQFSSPDASCGAGRPRKRWRYLPDSVVQLRQRDSPPILRTTQ